MESGNRRPNHDLVHLYGANYMNTNPLFMGMVKETTKSEEEQAHHIPSGNVSSSEENFQVDPSQASKPALRKKSRTQLMKERNLQVVKLT